MRIDTVSGHGISRSIHTKLESIMHKYKATIWNSRKDTSKVITFGNTAQAHGFYTALLKSGNRIVAESHSRTCYIIVGECFVYIPFFAYNLFVASASI